MSKKGFSGSYDAKKRALAVLGLETSNGENPIESPITHLKEMNKEL